jgi:hypothetical protein
MLTENQWKARLKAALVAQGAVVLSVHGHAMQAPGWPDLFFTHSRGRAWMELKMHDGELREAQRIVLRKLNEVDEFSLVLRLARDQKSCTAESFEGVVFWTLQGSLPAREIIDACCK